MDGAGVARRLVVAIVLVAALAAGGLALVSTLIVEDALRRDAADRAEVETRLALGLAAGLSETSDLGQFVEGFAPRGVAAVARGAQRSAASRPGLSEAIPAQLEALVERGLMGYERATIAGVPHLVSGGRPAGAEVDLFLFFPEASMAAALAALRDALVVGWLIVVIAALLVGRWVSRRTLAPVAQAAVAARAIAGGRLETRLPVQGSDEVGRLAAAFNQMADALARKIEQLTEAQARERRFTSDVAHELRTPVTALVTEASLLEEQLPELPLEAREPARLLVADIARLHVLVEDLLEISRFDAEQERPVEETFDLGSLATALLRARGWQEEVAFERQPVIVRSDPRRVERILANLVGNALVHAGRDVRLTIGNDALGAFAEVADRGPGIPPQQLARLFERFTKVSPSRTGSGSGLGLAIAAEHAALLGGRIDVSSRVGAGSRFTLRLPVTGSLPAGDGAVARDRQASPIDTPQGASP